jgi:hypothetical protein
MLNVDHPKPTQEHKISPDQTSAPGRSGIHRPEQWAGSPLPATTSQTAGPGRTADSRSEPRCRPPEGRPRCPVRSPRCRCSLVFVLAVAAVRAGLGKELPAADEGAAEDRGSARKPRYLSSTTLARRAGGPFPLECTPRRPSQEDAGRARVHAGVPSAPGPEKSTQ